MEQTWKAFVLKWLLEKAIIFCFLKLPKFIASVKSWWDTHTPLHLFRLYIKIRAKQCLPGCAGAISRESQLSKLPIYQNWWRDSKKLLTPWVSVRHRAAVEQDLLKGNVRRFKAVDRPKPQKVHLRGVHIHCLGWSEFGPILERLSFWARSICVYRKRPIGIYWTMLQHLFGGGRGGKERVKQSPSSNGFLLSICEGLAFLQSHKLVRLFTHCQTWTLRDNHTYTMNCKRILNLHLKG